MVAKLKRRKEIFLVCFKMINNRNQIKGVKKSLNELLIRVRQEINKYWKKLRTRVIETLDDDSDLRKRYELSVEEVINYCFICPSIDREVIEVLKNNKYQLTGFLQILTSPTTKYEAAKMEEYMREGRRLIEEQKKD